MRVANGAATRSVNDYAVLDDVLHLHPGATEADPRCRFAETRSAVLRQNQPGAFNLRQQTACGKTGQTSGLIGGASSEVVGCIAVEPRRTTPQAVQSTTGVNADEPRPVVSVSRVFRGARGLRRSRLAHELATVTATATVEYGDEPSDRALHHYLGLNYGGTRGALIGAACKSWPHRLAVV